MTPTLPTPSGVPLPFSFLILLPTLVVLHVTPACLLPGVIDFRLRRSDAFHRRQLVLHTLLLGCRSGPHSLRDGLAMRFVVVMIELGVKGIMGNRRCAPGQRVKS